ncbi:MAG: insulinase family protein [Deltaproteobacteria bacterium]|nr:insulinase family protein [Deltaproteobacteria bacterium]
MVNKTVLENGLRIVSERLDHFRSISLGIWVNVGSRDEGEAENGVSHFIEHMIFKGTAIRNSLRIAKELDSIGGLSNAFTGTEYTCFHSRVLDKHLQALADILSDIFLHSLFDLQDVNRERQVILQEISMLEDTPDEHIHVLFSKLFWMGHPLGMPVMGTPQTVSAINKDKILSHIRRFYTPGRIIIAAAGNVDHATLVEHFRPLFESLPKEKEVPCRMPPCSNGAVSCRYKELEQVHLCLGGTAPHLYSELRFAGAVFNTILGSNMSSRLFQEIREKRGLAYNVYSFLSSFLDAGVMGIYLGTDERNVNRALKIIHREIEKIQRGKISRADLRATKEHLVGGILLSSENTDTQMMRLAKNEGVFNRFVSYDELVGRIEKVTIDEVVAVAKETFQGQNVSLMALGPLEEKQLDLDNVAFD